MTNTHKEELDVQGLRAQVAAGNQAALKTLSAAGYIGASTIHEVPDFAEMQKLLSDLKGEHARLTTLQTDLVAKLKNSNMHADRSGTTEDRARALLNGEPLPKTASEALGVLGDEELQARTRIAEIEPILRALPTRLERIREAARASELAADKRTAQVKTLWEKALATLQAAITAEDELLTDLRARGFGGQEPLITNPYWLARDEALKA